MSVRLLSRFMTSKSTRFFSTIDPREKERNPEVNGMPISEKQTKLDLDAPFDASQFIRKDKITGEVLSTRTDEIEGGPTRYGRYFAGAFCLAFLFYYFSMYNDATKKTVTSVTQYQTSSKVAIGGPFDGLINQDGAPRSSSDYKDMYRLIYFGFTECPDICPTEIRKMIKALKIVQATHPEYYNIIKPIFISVDTRRDTPARLKEYAKHFTPNIDWLTGPEDKIMAAAKKYRVHYSIPDDIQEGENYNVDHSIFFYFMDKNDEFINFFGQNMNAQEIAASIVDKLNTDHGKMDQEDVSRKLRK